MGGACCVAARDKTIVTAAGGEVLHRNIRYSPTWSFRWDNRGRVAGEETSISWFSDGISRNDGSDVKYESAYASEDGSPLEGSQRGTWQKSPTSEGTSANLKTPTSDQSISRNVSVDTSFEQVESTESLAVSNTSPTKLSLSLPSTSSFPTSPLSSQSHSHPVSSTTPRWPPHSSAGCKSLNSFSVTEERSTAPSWSNEFTLGSHGGSSDGWSMHAFSELMATSHRERWSFDNEPLGFNHDKTRYSGQISSSPSGDLQTCRVCSKLLTERSLWSSQKLIVSNELSVVAVLTCGHVYHAECLETMTSEIDKYDPTCPVCTLGEKQTLKLSQKALKAEMDMKARNKKFRNRVVDSNLDDDFVMFDRLKASGREGKDPKMASSSSMKSSLAKPFLRRHFSFGSKGSKSLTENQTIRKKGFFWTRSMKG